jgi:hypothetical protein
MLADSATPEATMATKRTKGTIERIFDSIGELVRQPMSDESNEVPTAKAVRRSKRVAAGKRKTKAKKPATKKRTTAKRKAKPAARKKKR